MQSSLPQDLIALGSSTLLSIISMSCAIFIAIGQAIFQRQLQSNLGSVVGEDVVNEIINSGVTDISSLVSTSDLPMVIQKYSLSVTQVFVSTRMFAIYDSILSPKSRFTRARTHRRHLVYSGSRTSHLLLPGARVQVDLYKEQAESDRDQRRQ